MLPREYPKVLILHKLQACSQACPQDFQRNGGYGKGYIQSPGRWAPLPEHQMKIKPVHSYSSLYSTTFYAHFIVASSSLGKLPTWNRITCHIWSCLIFRHDNTTPIEFSLNDLSWQQGLNPLVNGKPLVIVADKNDQRIKKMYNYINYVINMM